MSDTARAIAEQFEQANQDVIATVEGLSDAQWAKTTTAEGWTVAATTRHIADGHQFIGRIITRMANGEPMGPFDMNTVHARNAEASAANVACPKDETLARLRENGAATAALNRSLTDEQLARTSDFPGRTVSVEDIGRHFAIGHVRSHLESIRASM